MAMETRLVKGFQVQGSDDGCNHGAWGERVEAIFLVL